mmetsp:Transcript_118044/g.235146  ORF Transcript_118044/g.235146 Transcript_118044/m.235146 type:complete len:287 (-) Transcript_118044:3360-4220(-)
MFRPDKCLFEGTPCQLCFIMLQFRFCAQARPKVPASPHGFAECHATTAGKPIQRSPCACTNLLATLARAPAKLGTCAVGVPSGIIARFLDIGKQYLVDQTLMHIHGLDIVRRRPSTALHGIAASVHALAAPIYRQPGLREAGPALLQVMRLIKQPRVLELLLSIVFAPCIRQILQGAQSLSSTFRLPVTMTAWNGIILLLNAADVFRGVPSTNFRIFRAFTRRLQLWTNCKVEFVQAIKVAEAEAHELILAIYLSERSKALVRPSVASVQSVGLAVTVPVQAPSCG